MRSHRTIDATAPTTRAHLIFTTIGVTATTTGIDLATDATPIAQTSLIAAGVVLGLLAAVAIKHLKTSPTGDLYVSGVTRH